MYWSILDESTGAIEISPIPFKGFKSGQSARHLREHEMAKFIFMELGLPVGMPYKNYINYRFNTICRDYRYTSAHEMASYVKSVCNLRDDAGISFVFTRKYIKVLISNYHH